MNLGIYTLCCSYLHLNQFVFGNTWEEIRTLYFAILDTDLLQTWMPITEWANWILILSHGACVIKVVILFCL